jgi:hypothetical protein
MDHELLTPVFFSKNLQADGFPAESQLTSE